MQTTKIIPVKKLKPLGLRPVVESRVSLLVEEVPVVEYPANEDPVQLALRTQENDEGVQPWDFLDRAHLVKKLYDELGTQEKVAERLGWTQRNVGYYLDIAQLSDECRTIIRKSSISTG